MASKHRKNRKPTSGTELLRLVRQDKREQAIAAGQLRSYGMVGQTHAPTKEQQNRRDRRDGKAQARDHWE